MTDVLIPAAINYLEDLSAIQLHETVIFIDKDPSSDISGRWLIPRVRACVRTPRGAHGTRISRHALPIDVTEF